MTYHLTVTEPFGNYKKGELINDPVEVGEVLTGPNQHHVVKHVPKKEHVDGSFFKSDEQLRPKKLMLPKA